MANEAIEREIEGWQKFEAVMYQEDRKAFDKMMLEARQFLDAFPGSKQDPAEVLILTLIFQQQKLIDRLLKAIETKVRKKGK